MDYKLNGEPRELTKKKVKHVRKAGMLPGAIFGFKGNFNVQVPAKEFALVYKEASHTGIVVIDIAGKQHNVIIDEVQFNPVTGVYTHVSLRELKMDEEITADIPFVLIGAEESPAVKEEEQIIILSVSSIELKGLPRALPQEIEINVSEFHAGDTIELKDVKLPEKVALVQDDEESLSMVIATTASAIQAEIIENVDEAVALAVAEGEEKPVEGEEVKTEEKEK